MIRTFFLFAALFAAGSAFLCAQNNSDSARSVQYSLGFIGGLERISNQTSLPIIPGSTDCGLFSDGTATGYWGGVMFDYPILAPYLDVSARLLYNARPAVLEAQTQVSEVYDRANDRYTPLFVGHKYDAMLGYLAFDVGVRVIPYPEIPVYVRLSADAGQPLFGATYEQRARVDDPSFVLFNDGTKEHVTRKGDIDDATTSYGALGALGMDIPLRGNMVLVPEIGYRYGLGSVVSRSEWHTESVRAGIGLKWIVYNEPAAISKPNREAPKEAEPPSVVPSLVINSLSSRPLEVQETIVTQTFPLLPYVFFDSTAAELRPRYMPAVADRARFQEKDLPKHAISTYYYLLHIIGKRMQEYPNARLTITGTTDGKELASPSDRKAVADRRAKVVADYLVNTWGVDRQRITLRSVDLPELASSARYAEGDEENRRTEIASDDPAILAPVVHSRFLEYIPIEDTQQFSIEVLHPERAQGWDLSMYYSGALMAVKTGEKAPKAIETITVATETLTALGGRLQQDVEQLTGTLQITQDDGSVLNADCQFPVKKTRNEFEVSRLSLIVFDFDRSDISSQNREMMDRFVTEAVKPASDVHITGSTDRLGEAAYNMELSKARAETVQQYLKQLRPGTRIQSVRGIGASTLPYDNTVPEGRYYCRTVSLEVRTPVKK